MIVGIALLTSALLVYAYGGAVIAFRVMGWFRRRAVAPSRGVTELPGLTVFFSAFNEEDLVRDRILNIMAQEYPKERLEVIVVSDGSTDRTAECAQRLATDRPESRIRVIEFSENCGRAAAQNTVAREARHEILLATDADSEFGPGCLVALGRSFDDPEVGVVGGVIHYRAGTSDISKGIGTYRRMEYALRDAEERAGVLAKTDGPCTAYRREIWDELEEFEDVDHVVILLARKRGLIAVQAKGAVCYDTPNAHWRQEVRARSRMTRKGLLSINKRWRWRDVRRDPLFSLALYSHRHLRYLSPVFLVTSALSLTLLTLEIVGGWWLMGSAAAVVVGYALRLPGLRGIVGRLSALVVANAGFALGIMEWLAGNRTGRYIPARHLGR